MAIVMYPPAGIWTTTMVVYFAGEHEIGRKDFLAILDLHDKHGPTGDG